MSERALASRVVKILKHLDAVRVENPCHPGTPDVNYADGWIELKQEDHWPVRETTVLSVPHFSPQQRIWLSRRVAKGGQAFLLLQVDRDFLLFRGNVAAQVVGLGTKQQLIEASIFTTDSKQLPELLINAINQRTIQQ